MAKWLFLFNDYAANFIGYSVCIVLGFFMNAKWTFNLTDAKAKEFISYVAISCMSYMLNLGAVAICIELLNLSGDGAQLFGVIVYSATSFLIMKSLFGRK